MWTDRLGRQGAPAGRHSRMLASLRSRGPDEAGYAESDWFRLGVCRLAIVDLDGGHQPVSSPGGDVCLAFNGEIYNDHELAKRLGSRREEAGGSEVGLLLQAYLRYGPAFVEYLDGDFAIIVMDSRTRACYAFRDAVGVKPLYYSRSIRTRMGVRVSRQGFFPAPEVLHATGSRSLGGTESDGLLVQ